MVIAIDLGHQCSPYDIGADGVITEETIINEVGELVIEKLKALGYTVITTRPSTCTSVSNSLFQRYNKSDNSNADWCISIHANASNGQGHGTEIFTYNAKELPEARNILNNLVDLGFTDRGIKDGSNLAMVKRPQAKAMLIEICFCDNENDVDIYNNVGAEAIASAIVLGLTGQTITTTKLGWNQNGIGWWYCTDVETGHFHKLMWAQIEDEWYYFNVDGYAKQSTWFKDSDLKWYYLKDSCKMAKSEWLWIDGECYCFDSHGALYINCKTPDNYYVDETGAWFNTKK